MQSYGHQEFSFITGLQPGDQMKYSQEKPFKRFLVILTSKVTALKRGVNEILTSNYVTIFA